MTNEQSRRDFLKTAGIAAAALGLGGATTALAQDAEETAVVKRNYGISLAGWSLHRSIGEGDGKYPMLDFPKLSREEFGIEAIELVNHMLASDTPEYLAEFAKNAANHNTEILLIMVDGQGDIGSRREELREAAVTNHQKWVDIAADFGCHSIRMNWRGHRGDVMTNDAELEDFIARSVAPLRKLCDYGDKKKINVLIENHGGPSSYPGAMEDLIKAVDHERFGTLPDFGNFPDGVDLYDAVDRLMPAAKAVSAKCYDFDHVTGEETRLDFGRLIEIVHDKHGYDGYIGIEYEGQRMSEFDGIKACRDLLIKLKG